MRQQGKSVAAAMLKQLQGVIPNQGKVPDAVLVEGFRVSAGEYGLRYSRGYYSIKGGVLAGWDITVAKQTWLHDEVTVEDRTVGHFDELDAAVVWVKLRLADEPHNDEPARKANKAAWLGVRYGMGQEAMKKVLGAGGSGSMTAAEIAGQVWPEWVRKP